MNDGKQLCMVISAGFLFLGGLLITLVGASLWGLLLVIVGLVPLLVPIGYGLVHFLKWLFTNDEN